MKHQNKNKEGEAKEERKSRVPMIMKKPINQYKSMSY
jgi:hypothetical protein